MLALVTSREAADRDTDLPLLVRELPEATVVHWDDNTVNWSEFDTVVIRSPWDYHRRRDEFLMWAESVSAISRLWNPVDVLRWNTDKRYLEELAGAGLDVTPTTFCHGKADVFSMANAGIFDGDVIVKPTVGASASGVRRFIDARGPAAAHARWLIEAGHVAMVQPYLSEIDTYGETCLVYLGGQFSHAVRRRVVLTESIDEESAEESSRARPATAAERALGDAVIDWLPGVAYARIDLLPTEAGPVLLEVEVTEPSLFLELDDAAPAQAAAVFRSL